MRTSAQARALIKTDTGAFRSIRSRVRVLTLRITSVIIMTVGAVTMLALALGSLFQARRFYREVIGRWIGRVILWVWGIRVEVHQDEPWPETQTIYVSNHTSTLDMFVLLSLALPNTRYFLSGFLRKIVPIAVIGYLMGIFWTYPQTQPGKRIRCFQAADRALRRTGESVYLSPEGERVTTGQIGHFNKGAFHLATSLKVPILPFYIQIPRDVDPGQGMDARPGLVRVYMKPMISTSNWKLEDLDQNKKLVRDMFIGFHEVLRPR